MIESRRVAQKASSVCKTCNEPIPSAGLGKCPNCGDAIAIASARTMVKTAQRFYPSHQFDSSMTGPSKAQEYAGQFQMSDRQQYMIDAVMNASPGPLGPVNVAQAPGISPLVDLILRPQPARNEDFSPRT